MNVCQCCNAEIRGYTNFWHQNIAPNDNPNKKLDISKPMVNFCSSSCLSSYINKYSGKSEGSLKGAPNNTNVVSILKEPYKNNTRTSQQLDKEGFKRLENDKKQQIIYKRLQKIKNMENSNAKVTTTCDNCKSVIDNKEEKNDTIKATLSNPSDPKKNKDYIFCDQECLRQHLNSKAKKKKSKASDFDVKLSKSNENPYVIEIEVS